MNRSALIIGHPGDAGQDRTGVQTDLREYRAFLLRAHGGWWNEFEIEVLLRPSRARVELAVAGLSEFDYSLVVFSGHADQRQGSIYMQLEDGFLDADELRTGRRQTIVLDCCRVEREIPELLEEDLYRSLRKAAANLDGEKCRELYDDGLRRCTRSLVKVCACAPGQEAQGNRITGGLYSNHLLRIATDWAAGAAYNKPTSLSIVDAHDASADAVNRTTRGLQTPHLAECGRGGPPYFPFCVVA
jgi:hypothetical protein